MNEVEDSLREYVQKKNLRWFSHMKRMEVDAGRISYEGEIHRGRSQ